MEILGIVLALLLVVMFWRVFATIGVVLVAIFAILLVIATHGG